jgi:mannosyl-3-phosphoglycerate phosphatase
MNPTDKLESVGKKCLLFLQRFDYKVTKLVIFSDLDGTFLDHHTYSFAALLPTLQIVKSRRIPLVFCSSKTRAEIEEVRKDAGIDDPFIVENGAALFVPENYFAFEIPEARREASYWICELGTPYAVLSSELRRLSRKTGVPVTGFADMSVERVATECGLSVAQARLAKKREYDEPFKILTPDPEAIAQLESAIARSGLRCTRGGRFFHLVGNNDKGEAVRRMARWLERSFGRIITVGIGDSRNDLDMLRVVEAPALVRKPGGAYDETIAAQIPNLRLAQAIGPAGWNEVVAAILCKDST